MVTEEACAPALGQAQTPKDHLCLRKYQRMVCSRLIANLTGNSELLMPRSARIKSKNINEKDVGTIVLKIAQVQRGPGRPSESFQVLPPTISRDLAHVTGGHCVTCVEQHHHGCEGHVLTAIFNSPDMANRSFHATLNTIVHGQQRPWMKMIIALLSSSSGSIGLLVRVLPCLS